MLQAQLLHKKQMPQLLTGAYNEFPLSSEWTSSEKISWKDLLEAIHGGGSEWISKCLIVNWIIRATGILRIMPDMTSLRYESLWKHWEHLEPMF